MADIHRDLWPIWLKQGNSEQDAQDHVQVISEELHGGDSTSSGQSVPVVSHMMCSTEVFPDVAREYLVFPFVPFASCPAIGHHYGRAHLSLLYALPSGIDKFLGNFPRPKLPLLQPELSQVSPFPHSRYCNPFIIFII